MTEPAITTGKGRPVSLVVPIKNYATLLEPVEDAVDAAWLKGTRKQPLHYRPLENDLVECKRK